MDDIVQPPLLGKPPHYTPDLAAFL